MHEPQAINLSASGDIDLHCAGCARGLSRADVRRGVCPICLRTFDLGAEGMADIAAIAEMRSALDQHFESFAGDRRRSAKEALPPLGPLTFWFHIFHYLNWTGSKPGEEASLYAQRFRCEGPRRAPMYADAQELQRQRLLHALMIWWVEIIFRVIVVPLRQGAKTYKLIMVGVFGFVYITSTGVFDRFTIPYFGFILYVPVLVFAYWRQIRELVEKFRPPMRLDEGLRRELLGLGLRCERRIGAWIVQNWAGAFDRDEYERGRDRTIVTGGADMLGGACDALVFFRGGLVNNDLVVYLPMVDDGGATRVTEAAKELARASAARIRGELDRHGWTLVESPAGIYAALLIDNLTALMTDDWCQIAADIGALLELPAGLGKLSSRTAIGRLRAAEVRVDMNGYTG